MPDRFLIETHAHTKTVSPCGHLSPRELARGYASAGYSGIIVTDHLTATLPILTGARSWRERVRRYFSGYRAVREAGEVYSLAVFPGFELSLTKLPGRDLLVYGIDEPRLAGLPDLCTMDFPTCARLLHEAGALIFQAHPFRNHLPADPGLIDGIEVHNGNPRHDSRNDLAAAFAEANGLYASSGSDAHRLEDIARGGISLPEMPSSIEEIVRRWRDDPEAIELFMPTEVCSDR